MFDFIGGVAGGIVDDVIDSAHSHVGGMINAGQDYLYNSVNNAVDSLGDRIVNEVMGNKASAAVYMTAAKQAARKVMTTPFVQGWQWYVEITNAPFDLDFYVKDLDFGAGSIDADVFQVGAGSFALPTFSSAGEVSMTVRDNEDLRICRWFDSMLDRVKNKNGTVNLPVHYVFNMKVYVTSENGNKRLLSDMQVFALKKGNFSLSREANNTFMSVPLTFQKFSTVGSKNFGTFGGLNSTGDVAGGLIDAAVDAVTGIF